MSYIVATYFDKEAWKSCGLNWIRHAKSESLTGYVIGIDLPKEAIDKIEIKDIKKALVKPVKQEVKEVGEIREETIEKKEKEVDSKKSSAEFLESIDLYDYDKLETLYLYITDFFLNSAGIISDNKEDAELKATIQLINERISELNNLLKKYFETTKELGVFNNLELLQETATKFDIDLAIKKNKERLLAFLKNLKLSVNDWVFNIIVNQAVHKNDNDDMKEMNDIANILNRLLIYGYLFKEDKYDISDIKIYVSDGKLSELLFYLQNIDINYIKWGIEKPNTKKIYTSITTQLHILLSYLLDIYTTDNYTDKETIQYAVIAIIKLLEELYKSIDEIEKGATSKIDLKESKDFDNIKDFYLLSELVKGGAASDLKPEDIDLAFIDKIYKTILFKDNKYKDSGHYESFALKRREYFDSKLKAFINEINAYNNATDFDTKENKEELLRILNELFYENKKDKYLKDDNADFQKLLDKLKEIFDDKKKIYDVNDLWKIIQEIFYYDKVKNLNFKIDKKDNLTFEELLIELLNGINEDKLEKYKKYYDNETPIKYKKTDEKEYKDVYYKDLFKLKPIYTSKVIFCDDISFFTDIKKTANTYTPLKDKDVYSEYKNGLSENVGTFGKTGDDYLLFDKNNKDFPYVFNYDEYPLPVVSFYLKSEELTIGIKSVSVYEIMVKPMLSVLKVFADSIPEEKDDTYKGFMETSFTSTFKRLLKTYIYDYLGITDDIEQCNLFQRMKDDIEGLIDKDMMQFYEIFSELKEEDIENVNRCLVLNLLKSLLFQTKYIKYGNTSLDVKLSLKPISVGRKTSRLSYYLSTPTEIIKINDITYRFVKKIWVKLSTTTLKSSGNGSDEIKKYLRSSIKDRETFEVKLTDNTKKLFTEVFEEKEFSDDNKFKYDTETAEYDSLYELYKKKENNIKDDIIIKCKYKDNPNDIDIDIVFSNLIEKFDYKDDNDRWNTIDGKEPVEVFTTNPTVLRVTAQGRSNNEPILEVD